MEKSEKQNNLKFGRCDGVVFPGSDFSNSIQETWIHKKIVKKTGEGEDDWILEEVPFKTGEVDIHKTIQEEAKKNNLKALILQVLRTGDESLLMANSTAQFGDISRLPSDPIEAKKLLDKNKNLIDRLPDSLKGKSMDDLLNMSTEDLLKAFGRKIESKEEKPEVKPEVVSEVKPEEKGQN